MRRRFAKESSGHDWWHIERVWKMARWLAKKEGADLFVVELAALLHDIADWKFHQGDDTAGPRVARPLLSQYGVAEEHVAHICHIIKTMSFKGAGVETKMETLEGKIVQDADRLDAIGAIGIARAFAYGGYKNQPMHEPDQKPVFHQTKEEYFHNSGTTLNHFYEKLLLLKDRLNTRTAKRLAMSRHQFMEDFLKRFFEEWEGRI
ncbi:MAG: HD domain-containing protein [Deltaproteobacteria bacterium]|nr:HD domain-containing protein [Deltaproteobacteria bacterium]MBI4223589.1 HD domain-containing protein [Deltaproteobacteria bacterium]